METGSKSLSDDDGDSESNGELLPKPGPRVEVRDGIILMYHSADPSAGILRFTPPEWWAFLAGVANGEFTFDALQQLPPEGTEYIDPAGL